MLRVFSAFFAFGAVAAGLSALTLTIPGTPLDIVWMANAEAHTALGSIGPAASLLMAVVSLACLLTAYGLWTRASWGRQMAIGILAINLISDLLNAVLRGDIRTLIGLPIGGAMIAYLCLARVRANFRARGNTFSA